MSLGLPVDLGSHDYHYLQTIRRFYLIYDL